MRRGIALAVFAGAATLGTAAIAWASGSGRRRIRPSFAGRASESPGRVGLSATTPPPGPGAGRRTICAPAKGKHWVRTCMTMPGGPGPTVTTPDAVCNLLRSEASLDQADRERFYAVLVDVRQQIVGIDEVAIGDMTGVSVHPREAFRSAVLAGASAVIFAHNHPSGDPTPSDDDVNLTRHLATVGKVLGIPVLDHVVIGKSWPGRTSRPCTSLAQLRPKLFSVED